MNSFRILREVIYNLEFPTQTIKWKIEWRHFKGMTGLKILCLCITLQETTRWYILPKCGHNPRKNNKWFSGNRESNIGEKQKKILGWPEKFQDDNTALERSQSRPEQGEEPLPGFPNGNKDKTDRRSDTSDHMQDILQRGFPVPVEHVGWIIDSKSIVN